MVQTAVRSGVAESVCLLSAVAADTAQLKDAVSKLSLNLSATRKALAAARSEFAAGNATLGGGLTKGLQALGTQLREQQQSTATQDSEVRSLLRSLQSEQRQLASEVSGIHMDVAALKTLSAAVGDVKTGVQQMRAELAKLSATDQKQFGDLSAKLEASNKSVSALQANLVHLPSAEQSKALRDSQQQLHQELAAIQSALAQQATQLKASLAAAKPADERKQCANMEQVVGLLKEQQGKLEAGIKTRFEELGANLKKSMQAEFKQAVAVVQKGFSELTNEVKSGLAATNKELVSSLCSLVR